MRYGAPAACNDGVDNNGDSYIDCSDFGCGGVGVRALVVNECLPHPASGSEWIELWTPTGTDVDASGAFADDVSGGSAPQALGAGSVVPAHGVLLVTLSSNKLDNTVREPPRGATFAVRALRPLGVPVRPCRRCQCARRAIVTAQFAAS